MAGTGILKVLEWGLLDRRKAWERGYSLLISITVANIIFQAAAEDLFEGWPWSEKQNKTPSHPFPKWYFDGNSKRFSAVSFASLSASRAPAQGRCRGGQQLSAQSCLDGSRGWVPPSTSTADQHWKMEEEWKPETGQQAWRHVTQREDRVLIDAWLSSGVSCG